MSQNLEIARKLGAEVLTELSQWSVQAGQDPVQAQYHRQQYDLNDPANAENFLALVFPELEKKMGVAERAIEKERATGASVAETEAAHYLAKGMLYEFAMKPASTEWRTSPTTVAQFGGAAEVAIRRALELKKDDGDTEFDDMCLWKLAATKHRLGDHEGEIAALRQVVENGGKHEIHAATALLEFEADAEEAASAGGCFVATAAFGSQFDQEVEVLRRFRDARLLRSSAGSRFVRMYYRISPPVASWISSSSTRQAAVRWLLRPVVGLVRRFS